jgi:hypothetical protein
MVINAAAYPIPHDISLSSLRWGPQPLKNTLNGSCHFEEPSTTTSPWYDPMLHPVQSPRTYVHRFFKNVASRCHSWLLLMKFFWRIAKQRFVCSKKTFDLLDVCCFLMSCVGERARWSGWRWCDYYSSTSVLNSIQHPNGMVPLR